MPNLKSLLKKGVESAVRGLLKTVIRILKEEGADERAIFRQFPHDASYAYQVLFDDFKGLFEKLLRNVDGAPPENIDLLFYELVCRDSAGHDLFYWRNLFRRLSNFFESPGGSRPLLNTTRESGRRMSILVASRFLPSLEHAGGVRILDLVQMLSKEHDVWVFTAQPESELDRKSRDLLKAAVRGYFEVPRSQFTADVLLKHCRNEFGADFLFDILQYEFVDNLDFLNRTKILGRKTVLTHMECYSHRNAISLKLELGTGGPNVPHFAKEQLAWVEREVTLMNSVDANVFVSEPDLAYMSRFSSAKPSVVVPSGVSEEAILKPASLVPDEKGPKRPIAAFIGIYSSYINREAIEWYLVNVHPLVLEKVPDYQVHLIGKGPLGKLLALRPDDPSVVAVGEVADVVPALAAATVCLSPMRSGAGFRGKLNQYSALGKPTVSTSAGLMGTVYQPGISILVGDSPEQFADQIIRSLTDIELREMIAQKARDVVRDNYSWEKIIRKVIELYNSLLF